MQETNGKTAKQTHPSKSSKVELKYFQTALVKTSRQNCTSGLEFTYPKRSGQEHPAKHHPSNLNSWSSSIQNAPHIEHIWFPLHTQDGLIKQSGKRDTSTSHNADCLIAHVFSKSCQRKANQENWNWRKLTASVKKSQKMESIAHTGQTQTKVCETQREKNTSTSKHIQETEPPTYKALVQQWAGTKMKQIGATIGLAVRWWIIAHVYVGVDDVFRNVLFLQVWRRELMHVTNYARNMPVFHTNKSKRREAWFAQRHANGHHFMVPCGFRFVSLSLECPMFNLFMMILFCVELYWWMRCSALMPPRQNILTSCFALNRECSIPGPYFRHGPSAITFPSLHRTWLGCSSHFFLQNIRASKNATYFFGLFGIYSHVPVKIYETQSQGLKGVTKVG